MSASSTLSTGWYANWATSHEVFVFSDFNIYWQVWATSLMLLRTSFILGNKTRQNTFHSNWSFLLTDLGWLNGENSHLIVYRIKIIEWILVIWHYYKSDFWKSWFFRQGQYSPLCLVSYFRENFLRGLLNQYREECGGEQACAPCWMLLFSDFILWDDSSIMSAPRQHHLSHRTLKIICEMFSKEWVGTRKVGEDKTINGWTGLGITWIQIRLRHG